MLFHPIISRCLSRFQASFILGLVTFANPVFATAQTISETAAEAASALEFREIGPAVMGGRVSDIAVVESDPRIFYVGLGAGGVWKTMNDGMTWDPVFDDQVAPSIGALAVAPSNPNTVWAGTGEPQNRQSSPWGIGIFKSDDPALRAEAIVQATTYYDDPDKLKEVSSKLKDAMKGLDISEIPEDQMFQKRGW